ncbi:hypothetical protein [Microbulbifer spongiae]|uniref:Acyltransferase n=1 Tax=Microbulbifer spongiae TaxID=2944933 RepID=A0ABY9EA89_9GAMM|nr:hypothetical protein [Microbulbifer sp. MI-G]WKD49935.1 hypothetical protein M8T91_00450 [Microbulbifer sp. MI-G]
MFSLHWSKYREQGFFLGIRFLFWLHHRIGPYAFKVTVYPVVLFYYLKNRSGRKAIREYLDLFSKRFPNSCTRSNWRTGFQIFLNFSNSAIEKLEAWFVGVPDNQVNFPNRTVLHHLVTSGQGGLIIGSHLGNLEVSRALGSLTEVRVNVLVHTKHAVKFNRMMKMLNPLSQVRLIQVTEVSPALMMHLSKAIGCGELIIIVGDRIPINSVGRTCDAVFLGKRAPFPQGPYILASLLKCPIYTLFCLSSSTGYDIYMEKLCDRVLMKRNDREGHINFLVSEFAKRLERYCRLAPLQWYNFYPFWDQQR